MINRLKYISFKRDQQDKSYFKNIKYPHIPLSINDIYAITVEGDRLDLIANRYYGDSTLWWIIAKANGLKGQTSVTTEKLLRIPGNVSQIIQNFISLNG